MIPTNSVITLHCSSLIAFCILSLHKRNGGWRNRVCSSAPVQGSSNRPWACKKWQAQRLTEYQHTRRIPSVQKQHSCTCESPSLVDSSWPWARLLLQSALGSSSDWTDTWEWRKKDHPAGPMCQLTTKPCCWWDVTLGVSPPYHPLSPQKQFSKRTGNVWQLCPDSLRKFNCSTILSAWGWDISDTE